MSHLDTRNPDPSILSVSISDELALFIQSIGALNTTLPMQMLMMFAQDQLYKKNFQEFLNETCEVDLQKNAADGGTYYKVKAANYREFKNLERKCAHTKVGLNIIPRNYLVALVSQFDYFVGRLVRTLLVLKPEMLNASEKIMNYGQILKFNSMEEVREHILEKEIEALLRSSHSDQFSWLEGRFDVVLRKDLLIWPKFVELTERRNLFVHCDALISSQYIHVCTSQGFMFEVVPRTGDRLDVSLDYFETAYSTLLELGIKLAHVLWRKVLPSDRDSADENINQLMYDFIDSDQSKLAIILGGFALDVLLRTKSKDTTRRMLTINLAQAYKWTDKEAECIRILDKLDWTSQGDEFQIALSVLRDDFEGAAKLMKQIGKQGRVKQSDYQTWPLFREFRKSHHFQDCYEELYGEPFSSLQEMKQSEDQPASNSGEARDEIGNYTI